jgi:hypothetical protein
MFCCRGYVSIINVAHFAFYFFSVAPYSLFAETVVASDTKVFSSTALYLSSPSILDQSCLSPEARR